MRCLADDNPVGDIQTYLNENPPDAIQIPDSMSDAEAVRTVQEQYDHAGLACAEEPAHEIVREARRS